MVIPGRSFSTTAYKWGFNGQEKDDEVYGSGNLNTAMFWEYDTRLGRRWNVDPVVKPWESSYLCFGGNSILNIDPKGDDDYTVNSKGKIKWRKKTEDETDKLISVGRKEKLFYNKKGDLINNSIELKKGTLANDLFKEEKIDEKGNPIFGTSINFKDDNASAKKVFKFLADNTNVEWALVEVGITSSSKTKTNLFTSHQEREEYFSATYAKKVLNQADGVVKFIHTHSHPFPDIGDKDFGRPSDSDIESMKKIHEKFSGAQFYIYQNYTLFNVNGWQ